jgi:hypothetical protein
MRIRATVEFTVPDGTTGKDVKAIVKDLYDLKLLVLLDGVGEWTAIHNGQHAEPSSWSVARSGG